MKIIHLGKYYPPFMGGIENFMASLAAQQVEDGHEVSAIVHHHDANFATSIESIDNILVYRVKTFGSVAYAPVAPSFIKWLSHLIDKSTPDVIHIHMPNLSAFWLLPLLKARSIPWVVHWHADVIGSVPDLKIKLLYPIYRFFEHALLRKAAKIIATSENYFLKSEVLTKYRNKVEVIPLGIEDIPQVPSMSVPKETIQLLMIGRLTYYKGHRNMIKAIRKLTLLGIDVHLDIVGTGELKESITALVKKYSLEDNIALLGKLSEESLNKKLLTCDVLCLPSIEKTEAFGVVILEAARVGKPALVTDVKGSGMSWVVQDGKTGIVAKANDVADLAAKIQWASENRQQLENYGKNARKRFESDFRVSHIASQIENLYDKVLLSQ
ncbi:glycosyltransferase [Thalassotalea fusca]